jgi:hypothetical protein
MTVPGIIFFYRIYRTQKKMEDTWSGFQEDLKISTKRRNKFRKTYKMMHTFYFVISLTGLNRPNTRKDAPADNINNFH